MHTLQCYRNAFGYLPTYKSQQTQEDSVHTDMYEHARTEDGKPKNGDYNRYGPELTAFKATFTGDLSAEALRTIRFALIEYSDSIERSMFQANVLRTPDGSLLKGAADRTETEDENLVFLATTYAAINEALSQFKHAMNKHQLDL